MNNNFSENLKKIRKDNNLSQEQLAEELGVSRQAISKWEGAIAYPEMDKIIALCELFNLNIDDLLHKDIREVKGEEDVKKNLNKYIDDFLNFVTNTINLFTNMSFRSKVKCLFEQFILALILFIMFMIIGDIFKSLLAGIFSFMPDKVYFVIYSIIKFIYVIFSISISLMIILHIFKTRYLEYYDKIKKEVVNGADNNETETVVLQDDDKECEKINEKNKILFKKNESKIIIRDPKHSEYKFINGLSKIVVNIIKFFSLCFSVIFFIGLIGLVFWFVVSFLCYKTGIFFIGLLILLLGLIIIDINCILIILNFIFNRKSNKKKLIWSIILAFIFLGVGIGFVSIGFLDFEYVKDDKIIFKTDSITFDMNDELFFNIYYDIELEYIETDINNVVVEYDMAKNFDMKYSFVNDNMDGIYFYSECSNPMGIIKDIIGKFNDKKIINISSDIQSIRIYANSENILKLKNNREVYYEKIETRENLIKSYEKKISELEEENRKYKRKNELVKISSKLIVIYCFSF